MNKYIQKGFTLIEILVVIAVIGFLVAILVPNLSGVGAKKNDLEKRNIVKNVSTAIEMIHLETGAYPDDRFCIDNFAEDGLGGPAGAEELSVLAKLENKVPGVSNTNLNFDPYCNGDGTKVYYEKLSNSDNGNYAVYMLAEDSSNHDYGLHATVEEQDGVSVVTAIEGIESAAGVLSDDASIVKVLGVVN